jgi:hypothetical protein
LGLASRIPISAWKTAPSPVVASIYARHASQRAMSLRPRQNNSQRYPPETQQEVPHAVQISRLRLPRLQANESIPKFALVPLIFGVRQEKHKSAVAPLGCVSIHPVRGVFKKQPGLCGHSKTIHISNGVRKLALRPCARLPCKCQDYRPAKKI